MGILRTKLGQYTNCKHCIAVDLILKYNQKSLGREGSDTLFIPLLNMICPCDGTWRGVMDAYTTTGNSKYSYF